MKAIGVLVLGLSALFLVACESDSSSGSNVDQYCSKSCAKYAECNLLFGQTEAQCVSFCKSSAQQGGGGGSDCNPPQSKVDACFNALSSASCTELQTGLSACDLCPDDTSDASNGGDTSFSLDTNADGPECTALAACCPNLSGDQKSTCESTASLGFTDGCKQLLDLFVSLGSCTAE